MTIRIAVAALVAGVLFCGAADAAEFTVKMLNKDSAGRAMQFEPAFLKVAPGDVVHFEPADKGHDTESYVLPDGAAPWKGKLSAAVDVTFTVEGLYAYRCLPHFGLGMVGLIEVNNSSNLAAVHAGKFPGKAKQRMGELLDEMAKASP